MSAPVNSAGIGTLRRALIFLLAALVLDAAIGTACAQGPAGKVPPQLPPHAAEKAREMVQTHTAPTVDLTAPAADALYTAPATVTLEASASASSNGRSIAKVEFFAGATLIGTATTAPYRITWSDVAAGRYSLTARATDNLGVASTSSRVAVIVNAPPTVSITSPADNTVFTAPANITLTANAADSDGSIAKVEFYQGTSLIGTATNAPYSVGWTNVAAGSYTLTARATDDRGATATSAAVPVIVNAPPSVSIASPTDNASFTAPANITLTANAADSDGSIAKVEFYYGSTLIGTLTAPPYSAVWTGVPAGAYALTARATDNYGARTSSAPVAITVTAAVAATVYYVHTDHLNTPRLITNEAQQAVWRWDNTDPFGGNVPDENPSGLGAFTCNLRLPGQYFDGETGLHYNYFRDYDPSIGRYVESDPIGLRGGINTYLYVSADPLASIDLYGWKTFKICGAEGGVKFPDNFGPYSFAQACINHDACYDDCVKRPTKEACDKAFFTDTMNACKDIPFFFRVLGSGRECVDYAFKYSLAVARLGKKAFDEARRKCPPCSK